MSATRVVNIRMTDTWDFYCGRAGRGEKGTFGNPYTIHVGQPRGHTVNKLFRDHFEFRAKHDLGFVAELNKLIDWKKVHDGVLVLGCFCAETAEGLTVENKPYTCHAQVIAEYIDKRCP